ncbi:SMI1/KNR4 family protein [Deinococcus aestuarii]|uniref:SMI1/KNR4 family protein n=1 Tax=Deinococcus aestuarii TaxID=2774531 RepID=UPI001C0AD3AD|nr:SMI1/KNR4 family protein [Deinococcus aestuarii]
MNLIWQLAVCLPLCLTACHPTETRCSPAQPLLVTAMNLASPADLTAVLTRLEAWYAQHVPAVHATLRPGVTEAELDAFEARNDLRLPQAFRTLYRWHDGQDWSVGGVLGLSFMPLNEVEWTRQMWREIAEGETADMNISIYTVSHPTGAIREQYAQRDLLPFLSDGGGNHVALDLAPDVRGRAGQVITTGRDETHRYVLASDLEGFLREYLARLEVGQVTVEKLPGYEGEMWGIRLHDEAGPREDGYYRLADLYPGFGASPARVVQPHPQENDPMPLERSLDRLDAWLAEHYPDLLASLKPGADEADLQAAERRLGRPLPEEVKVFYRRHRAWGKLFGATSIPVGELGRADPEEFGSPDAPGNVVPFNPYPRPTTARDWLPLWQAEQGFIGVNLARYGEVLTFGKAARPRYVLAENLTRFLDRYVRWLEAGLLRRDGLTLRVPDAVGEDGTSGTTDLFPGFGAAPALR